MRLLIFKNEEKEGGTIGFLKFRARVSRKRIASKETRHPPPIIHTVKMNYYVHSFYGQCILVVPTYLPIYTHMCLGVYIYVCVCIFICVCKCQRAGIKRTPVYVLLSVPLGAKGKYNNLATIESEPHAYKS